ncbi:MAG: N-acetylmuramic acid 6-phosphate etherase [Sediminibacterium sp.]|jgi:N-acetylmuramic acid 6-phosphate etherase|nr:N-acetylmuramic acid 6-phosphate etherase [Chitinophagaceae bacterium]MCE2973767.1 N-acetylmuramic acid 6-phosphate etherase [Sediminibacterium sp.]MCA6471134.1 N-acetylmuramic acid 6-phosphate etherase [Chitinophagaceae bacterium]MCA6473322.1 N-acetylmuramic acid 6-phosphate etherase [Chitinophagaceae bacterium]MCA6477193.1 N-acetylmuramic acid 6-phosphate etherase [Chitinophagaceae bacterium]
MKEFIRYTEQSSLYRHLEKMTVAELLHNINQEDKTVPDAVAKAIPQIEKLVSAISDKMLAGGRLFYIGAGTSGRLGIVDASECPPTFGVPYGLVIGIIAGGDKAITTAVEFAEDNPDEGWNDLMKHFVSDKDVVVGLAASGSTPYVIGALKQCRRKGIITGSISCNPNAPVSREADFPVEIVVGPEFITGSTRMKSGTAQKLVLNMISTSVMIQLGRVEDNKMVNMQLSNVKLVDRGVKMVMEGLGLKDYEEAKDLLLKHGSVKRAIEAASHSH